MKAGEVTRRLDGEDEMAYADADLRCCAVMVAQAPVVGVSLVIFLAHPPVWYVARAPKC